MRGKAYPCSYLGLRMDHPQKWESLYDNTQMLTDGCGDILRWTTTMLFEL